MEILKYCALMAWILAFFGIAWYCLLQFSQITYVTLADGRKQARTLPFIFKILLPFVSNLNALMKKKYFKSSIENASWQLTAAGFDGLLSGKEFVALKLIIPFVFTFVWIIILNFLKLSENIVFPTQSNEEIFSVQIIMLLIVFGILFSLLFPMHWLRTTLKQRHKKILKSLPFVLDLLTLSVEAGMDFISAMQRNTEIKNSEIEERDLAFMKKNGKRKDDPLREELAYTIREIQVGVSRKEALLHLGERVHLPELRTICSSLIQADELGVSIGTILRIQAGQVRQMRFERAEKLANEAPTKMLFPLLLFIFPATLIILMAPILIRTMASLLN